MYKKAQLIGLTFLIYGVPLFIIASIPFTVTLYGFRAIGILFEFLLFYCVYLAFKKSAHLETNRTYLIATGLKKLVHYIFKQKIQGIFHASNEEKIALRLYAVKIFFTPLMISFVLSNSASFFRDISSSPFSWALTANNFVEHYFFTIFHFILLIDTLVFAFGYLVESPKLKNVVRSVEPTAFGWIIALLCYPPFNNVTSDIVGWYSSDFSNFKNVYWNVVFGSISLILFGIYVWATLALGYKASNLTNRGIVARGPYKYVRHPAYISKNLSWWVMGIPFIMKSGIIAVVSLAVWSLIYYMRALTEERHLSQDPDYIAYKHKVKYQFIPGIY
jgi:protein-S-isoprenylcysteine O-methyltransferase Ste14